MIKLSTENLFKTIFWDWNLFSNLFQKNYAFGNHSLKAPLPYTRSRFHAFLPEKERFFYSFSSNFFHIKIAKTSFISFSFRLKACFRVLAFFSLALTKEPLTFFPRRSAQWMCIIFKVIYLLFFTYHEFLWLFLLCY